MPHNRSLTLQHLWNEKQTTCSDDRLQHLIGLNVRLIDSMIETATSRTMKSEAAIHDRRY